MGDEFKPISEDNVSGKISPERSEPTASNSIFDANNDGKIDFDDFKFIFEKARDKAATAAGEAINIGRDVFKSKSEKDENSVEHLENIFKDMEQPPEDEEKLKCERFKSALVSTIDLKFADLMSTKEGSEKYLSYVDSQLITAGVRNIFKSALTISPPQVEAACNLSEAILAPSAQEKQNLIKASVALSGGTAGMGMIIGGIAAALGWGASMAASAATVFTGASIAGPAGWIVGGVSLAAIAGYFASTSNKPMDTERFMKVLKSASSKAVDAIWPKYGEALSLAMNNSNTTPNS